MINSLIRQGYIARNPFNKRYKQSSIKGVWDMSTKKFIYDTVTNYNKTDLIYDVNSSVLPRATAQIVKDDLIKKLIENNQLSIVMDIELPLAVVLAKTELNGFYVNKKRLVEIGEELTEKINA